MKNPPIDFLLVCSVTSLRDFELNRLNHAANLRKQLRIVADELLQAEAEAASARWLIEYRDQLVAARSNDSQMEIEFSPAGPKKAALPAPRKEMSA